MPTQEGHADVVKLLLDEVADTKWIHDASVWHPLHEAARKGQKYMIQILLNIGLDPNKPAEEDWTPLHYAAREGSEGVIRLLIDGGADVNRTDSEGKTPLHHAARWGHKGAVQLLISRGADSRSKYDALDTARQHGHHDIVAIIEEAIGAMSKTGDKSKNSEPVQG